MEFVGLFIVVIISHIICEVFKWIVLHLRNGRWKRKSRYQRRQERYNKIMEWQKDRFLFYMEMNKPAPQKKKEKRQTIIYKGLFAKEASEAEDLKK